MDGVGFLHLATENCNYRTGAVENEQGSKTILSVN